ncbi:UNVERIFIED_CONTAM: hypothetical protein K2H54_014445 [Gekko kuhli]
MQYQEILCRNSSLGSPSNICGSPPGAIGKPHSLESIGFPTDSVTAASSYKKAPGFEREDLVGAEYLKSFKCQQSKIKSHSMEHRSQEQPLLQPKQDILGILPVGSPLTSSISSSITSSLAATPPSPAGTSSVPGMNANALPFYPTSDTVESVIESALDDLDLNEFGVAALEKTFDSSSVPHTSGIMIDEDSPYRLTVPMARISLFNGTDSCVRSEAMCKLVGPVQLLTVA